MSRIDGGTNPLDASSDVERWLDRILGAGPLLDTEETKRDLLDRVVLVPHQMLLEEDEAKRHAGFQYIVRRLIIDIRYGCKSSSCTTLHCFSRQKRVAGKPLRRPTFLTARVISYFLASEPGAIHKLCPNEPVILPTALDDELDHTFLRPPSLEDGRLPSYLARPRIRPRFAFGPTLTLPVPASLGSLSRRSVGYAELDPLGDYIERTRKPDKKDRKSLSQNLFDTSAIKAFEWNQFRKREQFPANSKSAPLTPNAMNLDGSAAVGSMRIRDVPSFANSQRQRSASSSPTTSESANTLPSGHENAGNCISSPTHVHVASVPSDKPVPSLKGANGTSHRSTRLSRSGQPQPPTKQMLEEFAHHRLDGMVQSDVLDIVDGIVGSHPFKPDHPFSVGAAAPDPAHSQMETRAVSRGHDMSEPSNSNLQSDDPGTAPCISPLSIPAMLGLERLAAYTDRGPNESGESLSLFNEAEDESKLRKQIAAFVSRSLYFNLGNAHCIVKSFQELDVLLDLPAKGVWQGGPTEDTALPALKSLGLLMSEPGLVERALSLHSLSISLESLFAPPPPLHQFRSPRVRPNDRPDAPEVRHLSNKDAAKIILVCMAMLMRQLPLTQSINPSYFADVRKNGWVAPSQPRNGPHWPAFEKLTILSDELEYEPVVKLTTRLMQAIGARAAFDAAMRTIDGQSTRSSPIVDVFQLCTRLLNEAFLMNTKASGSPADNRLWKPSIFLLERIRTAILKNWDGNATIKKWSTVGGALLLMREMCKSPCCPKQRGLFNDQLHCKS